MSYDFRALALSLPSATERDHFGRPSFRIDGKIFAQLSQDSATAVLKLPHAQEWVIGSYPGARSSPGRWGEAGWTEFTWRNVPESILQDLLRQAWASVKHGSRSKEPQRSTKARSRG